MCQCRALALKSAAVEESRSADQLKSTCGAPTAEAPPTRLRDRIRGLPRLDATIFAVYFCAAFAVTLPVDLLPVIAAEHAARADAAGAAPFAVAPFVAAVASLSTLCGGAGKLVNGFVCQGLGGRRASSAYLLGMAAALVALASHSAAGRVALILGGLEFCASMQWTACAMVLATAHGRDPARLAAGMAALTLASTCGTLAAKAGGTALLGLGADWRVVARVGAAAALAGSLLVVLLVAEAPRRAVERWSPAAAGSSARRVLGSHLFWLVGLAHAAALVTRSADRVLGSFVSEATHLSVRYCGGLTASMTLGFLAGLGNVAAFHARPDVGTKTRFLGRLYAGATLSALGLAGCAAAAVHPGARAVLPAGLLAALIAACAGSMAFHLSFQVYQIPAMASGALFAADRAVALSLFDAVGFFLAAPVWAATGALIAALGDDGWIAAWAMLASLFAVGGTIMVRMLPAVLTRGTYEYIDDTSDDSESNCDTRDASDSSCDFSEEALTDDEGSDSCV